MSWFKGGIRFFLVTIGVIALTSLGIDATQYFDGSGSALSILTEEALEGSCPVGMQEIRGMSPMVCIDSYEASVGDDCSLPRVQSVVDTATLSNEVACQSVSKSGNEPWTFVGYAQAANICARGSKRLPTSEEWYRAALGTPDSEESCNIAGEKALAGSNENCISGSGAYDLIGNVWEWVAAEISDGVHEGSILPLEGYVATVDQAGIARTTTSTPQVMFNEDYFWSKQIGQYQMIRGGFYRSGTDAGLYSVHADIAPDFSGQAVGFRCVKDI